MRSHADSSERLPASSAARRVPPVVQEALKSSGQPLASADVSAFATQFGHDFRDVRVHTDGVAAHSADALDARAYTFGTDVVFARGEYAPETAGGRDLLAHELGHVVEQSASGIEAIQRQPRSATGSVLNSPRTTNYRFDTHHVTADDLTDPDIIARFESLSVESLRRYEKRVADDAVKSYVLNLIGIKERAERFANRPNYYQMVQEAVLGLEGAELADRTLSGLLLPLLKELSHTSRVTWRDDLGAETGGKAFVFKPPGKDAKPIKLRLVLDEGDPWLSKRAGHFVESKGEIALLVRANPTVKAIRETLFHEGLHLAAFVMRSQGKAALGTENEKGAEALEQGLNQTAMKADLKNRLELLRVEVNKNRSQRGVPAIAATEVDSLVPLLWEEIVVAAETSYFEIIRSIGIEDTPAPDYMSLDSVKIYLEHYRFMSKSDMDALTEPEIKRIVILQEFINLKIRALIKARGLTNEFIPRSTAPRTIFVR